MSNGHSAPVICTTPLNGTDEQVKRAHEISHWFGIPYVERRRRGLIQLHSEEHAMVMIVADDPIRLYHREKLKEPLFFHPSMAAQRLERMDRGEADRLCSAMNLQPGDTVVDATLGMAADAMVMARVVGPRGHVIGLEESTLVAKMLTAIQHFGCHAYQEAARLLEQVEIVQQHHLTWLSNQASDSVDIIYFDPMFRAPAQASASITPLRIFAHGQPLDERSIEEAKRVAKRSVVIRERPGSELFHIHRFVPDKQRRKVVYGVWNKRDG